MGASTFVVIHFSVLSGGMRGVNFDSCEPWRTAAPKVVMYSLCIPLSRRWLIFFGFLLGLIGLELLIGGLLVGRVRLLRLKL